MKTLPTVLPRIGLLVMTIAAAALWGCANQLDPDSTKAVLSEHQRDSTLAQSALPGAATLGRAMERADEAAVRAAALDSLSSP